MASCNICGCLDSAVLVEKDGRKVYQCANCRLAFTYPQPESLDTQYNESYFHLYSKRHQFRLNRAQSRLSVIELMTPPGRLLDVGCSLGYFLEAAIARGWDAEGVEISQYASEYARSKGLNVITGTLDDIKIPVQSYDCVTMWDVLEHVPDPTSQLRTIHHILKENGIIAIGTPDISHPLFRLKKEKWRHIKPNEHLYYFQRSNLEMLLRTTGFKPVLPPIWGSRHSDGFSKVSICEAIHRVLNLRDVITVYGMKESA